MLQFADDIGISTEYKKELMAVLEANEATSDTRLNLTRIRRMYECTRVVVRNVLGLM